MFGLAIQVSARAAHSIKRSHIPCTNEVLQTAVKMRSRCSAPAQTLVMVAVWTGWRPVRRLLFAPASPRMASLAASFSSRLDDALHLTGPRHWNESCRRV